MIADLLYLTNVRVAAALRDRWDTFYDGWTRAFANVPGCVRGSRWEVTYGLGTGGQVLPEPGWPVFQAFWEHPHFDDFIRSRVYRAQPEWQPRARAFEPWFRSLRDYATMHLHRIARQGDRDAALPGALLSTLWTIDGAAVPDFERWYDAEIAGDFRARLGATGMTRYVSALTHLHRYGDEAGKLVVPQRHHFEDGGRLVYLTLFHFADLPDPATQRRFVADLDERLGRRAVLGDRQEVFLRRLLVAEHDGHMPGLILAEGLPGQDARADVRQQMQVSVEIAASRRTVWDRGFASAAALRRWFGPETVRTIDDGLRVELEWADDADPDPRPMRVCLELDEAGGRTTVRLGWQGWERVPEPARSAQLRAFRDRLGELKRICDELR